MRRKRRLTGLAAATAGLLACTGVAVAAFVPPVPAPTPDKPQATGKYQKANYTGISVGTAKRSGERGFVTGFTTKSGTKLSKTKFKPVSMTVRTRVGNGTFPNTVVAPGGITDIPDPAVRTQVVFDKDLKLNFAGIPRCSADIAGLTAAQAKGVCGSSVVGGGTARLRFPGLDYEPQVTVVAFVGPKNANNQDTVLLFTDASPITTGTVLVGTIVPSKPSWLTTGRSSYGVTLDVAIPLLAGGAVALADFEATIGNGYKKGFITAKCPDRVFKTTSRFWFSAQDQGSGNYPGANEEPDTFLPAGVGGGEKALKCST